MATIAASIEVASPPETVYGYVTDPSRFGEWQENVSGGHFDGDGPHGVGAICRTTRRIGFADRSVTSEIARAEPPHFWSVRGIDGPVRAFVDVAVRAAAGDSRRTVLTISIDFEGHGIGNLLVLLVRRQATREMPRNLQRVKANLESRAGIANSNDRSSRRSRST